MAHVKKQCQKCRSEFFIEEQDLTFYVSMDVPEPTFCPECRLRRRLAWINLRKLYTRTLEGSPALVISMYTQDKAHYIVSDSEWWDGAFDMLQYGAPYDFSRTFFSQFHELLLRTPLPHLQRQHTSMENSEYCNGAAGLKNCYLVMAADQSEQCYYGYSVEHTKDSVDCAFIFNSELCYECVNCNNCYKTYYSRNCDRCSDVIFSRDCVGCTSCFGCANLKNKSFHIFNQPYSQKEYESHIAALNLSSYRALQELMVRVNDFFTTQPVRSMTGRNNDNVTGDYIQQSKDVRNSFMVSKGEHCRYCQFLRYLTAGTTDSYDYSVFGLAAERMYESAWCGLSSRQLIACNWCYGSNECSYSIGCHSSEYLFGCIGLRNARYCILNKQYTEDEYQKLVSKIISQMNTMPYNDSSGCIYRYGEYFPEELSPFAYNETIAQDFLPLSEVEAMQRGFQWRTIENQQREAELSWSGLPDTNTEASDDIAKKTISCKIREENREYAARSGCTGVFKMVPQEVTFYRRLGLPLPRTCHNCRHARRIGLLNPINKQWTRECQCCNHERHQCAQTFATSFAPNTEAVLYCEPCYAAYTA